MFEYLWLDAVVSEKLAAAFVVKAGFWPHC